MQHLAFINNLGTPELVIIFIAVLLLFGPKSIPKLARSLGQGIREFKDATNKVTESITNMDEDDSPVSRVPRATVTRIANEISGDQAVVAQSAAGTEKSVSPTADRSADEERAGIPPT